MRLLFLLVIMVSPLVAQEDMDFFNMSLEELNDISVVSASRREEPLREVPVPVTVITAEMIRKSGARNLADVLVFFVPGMTLSQDHNEVNVAMRGIYGSSQQKFLILVEGHRLNTRSFSQANPDYGISLDKIKQVEVLRGPGSSLYGNVALTAVVNLILFDGEDIGGLETTATLGNYGQREASLLYGKRLGAYDLLAWGNIYRSAGEVIEISPEEDVVSVDPTGGQAILDRFDESPSFDLGAHLEGDRFKLLVNYHQSKYSPPFTSGGITGQIYDYHDYPSFEGVSLGVSSRSFHLGLKTWRDVGERGRLELHAYGDTAKIVGGIVLDPQLENFAYPLWHERDHGVVVQYNGDYELRGKPGSLVAGIQADFMRLTDSELVIGRAGVFDPTPRPLMETGNEHILSGFFQLKQRLSQKFLFNGGLRYDHKDRGPQGTLSNAEPRLALVYLPEQGIDWKVSYASSFVDAPYWYRYNQLASYRGGADLRPEFLDAFQVTGTTYWGEDRHKLEFNAFHNKLTDFVFRDTTVLISDLENPIYKNAGELESVGLELTYRYHTPLRRINANITWQRALEAVDYGESDGDIYNVPSFTANLLMDFKLPQWSGYKTWFNLTLRHLSEQKAPIVIPALDLNLTEYHVHPVTLVNTGINFERFLGSNFTLDVRVYNAFDKDWVQGGSVQFPYPQVSRWFNMGLTYTF